MSMSRALATSCVWPREQLGDGPFDCIELMWSDCLQTFVLIHTSGAPPPTAL